MVARKFVCLIPARIGSTRFPRKPLALISGQPMIERVARNAASFFGAENTFVVTDSSEIASVVTRAGLGYIIVQDDCYTGTDRIALALSELGQCEWVFNLQGDEPIFPSWAIKEFVAKTFDSKQTVTNAYRKEVNQELISSQNSIKMVMKQSGDMAYASRSPIPSDNLTRGAWLQVCIYGFRQESLRAFEIHGRRRGSLEERENIEILRFLDLGIDVEMIETKVKSHAVDVPSDIQFVESIINRR